MRPGAPTIRRALRRAAAEAADSPPARALARMTAPWFAATPVRALPGWYGALQGIRVPRGAARYATPTPACAANVNAVLDLLDRTLGLEGQVAECGVYRGATLLPMALHLEREGARQRVLGFDSFQGFDRRIEFDLGLGGADDEDKRLKGFDRTSLELVSRKAERLGVADRVELIPGPFEETLPRFAGERFAFVHLDCDLYGSYRACLEFFYPRLARGGIVLFDEYDDPPWPGCNKAVDEFLDEKPETLAPIERDNHLKYYFCKA